MKRFLRIALIVLGLVAFALAVWFGGPLLGFAETYPLEGVTARVVTIGIVWGLVGLWALWRWWRNRRAERALEAAIAVEGPAGDGEVLGEKMREALAVLRQSSGSRNYLYDLPWYVIIGPPGAGKTTALLNSGVHFPLAEKSGGAIAGAGGTRYCDWWFAEEAVLIDTAGRYTTQDSDKAADSESWESFLALLKRHRPRQPVNGVIVALSLEDLLTGTDEAIEAHASAIRDRLMELHQVFRVDVPVYVLFTKADLVAGFTEFFGAFSASRRQKVWGATFRPKKRDEATLPQAAAEYDALLARLSSEVTDRMNDEPDGVSRIAIFGFPAQMAMLKDRVLSVLNGVFGATRYRVNATLRGFYFASGTQEGTPIDQILGAMERSFGGLSGVGASGTGKSYFLHDLLKKVIFAEAGWVSQDQRAVRREAVLRYGAIGAIVLATLGLGTAWGLSYLRNLANVRAVEAVTATYAAEARPELERAEISDTDLTEIAPLLQTLRDLAFDEPEDDFVETGFGLDQRDGLRAAARASYLDGLERMLLPRLVLAVEERIAADISGNDRLSLYESLKVYKFLGNAAPYRDDAFVLAWFAVEWEDDPDLRGGGPFRGLRDDLLAHLSTMLEMTAQRSDAPIDLNGALVARAEQLLSLMDLEDQAWLLVMGTGGPSDVEPVNLGLRAGPDADLVFETRDGRRLDELVVPAIFTNAGFHTYFLPRLADVATKLETEQWVLGTRAEAADIGNELARLGPAIMNRYALEFTRAWHEQLDALQLRPMSTGAPQFLALNAASDQRQSPILMLTQAVVAETRLTLAFDEPDGLGAILDGQVPEGVGGSLGSAAATVLLRRAQMQAQGLTRIGFEVVRQSRTQSRAGGAGGAAPLPLPGANVEAQFARWHDMLAELPDGTPISTLLADLQDIYRLLLTSTAGAGQIPATLGQELAQRAALLTRHASRMPPQLSRMVLQASEEFAGGAANTTLAALNQRLNNEVTQICEALIPTSYPFDRRSNRDLPVAEFARLFAPGGVIDRFFTEALLPHADLSGPDWQWREDSRLGAQMSLATLAQFERAAAIRDAYFPAGTPIPGFDISVRQTALHPDAETALLTLHGRQIVTQQTGSLAQSVFWPPTGGDGLVSVQLAPPEPGRESMTEAPPGPWALLRLIEAGRPRLSGTGVGFRVTVGGRHVSYVVQAGVSVNPFDLRIMRDFRCPNGL